MACNDNNIPVLFNFVLYFLFMRANGKQLVYDHCRKNASTGILLIESYIFFCKACFISFSTNYACTSGGKFTVDYELFVSRTMCKNVRIRECVIRGDHQMLTIFCTLGYIMFALTC